MYQNTVLAGVPSVSEVAVAGVPEMTCGGSEKKLLAAAMAEAAGRAVCARLLMALVSDVCRLAAVAAAFGPIVNWFAPGDALVVAVQRNGLARSVRQREVKRDRAGGRI